MNDDDWLGQALQAQKRGEHTKALKTSLRAPADAKSQIVAHVIRASSLAKLGRGGDAFRELQFAFDLGADSPEFCRLGAEVCARRGELEAALAWTNRALAPQTNKQKDNKQTRRMLELRGNIIAHMHLLSGLHEHAEFVVDLCPEWLEAREHLIESCLSQRLYSVADEHLDVALTQEPRRASLHIDKAASCVATGRRQAAIDALERANSLDISAVQRRRITDLFLKVGDLDRALRSAKENLEIFPGNPELQLQNAFFALWSGRPRDAEGLGRTLHEQTRGLTRLRAAIAFVDARDESALTYATEAVTHDPSDFEAHALLAAILFRLRRYDEAAQSSRAAQTGPEWLPAAQVVGVGAIAARRSSMQHHDAAELFELLAPLMPKITLAPNTRGHISTRSVSEAVAVALNRLCGNFSSTPTYLAEGCVTWSALPLKPPARIASLRTANLIRARPFPWVAERLAALTETYPRAPHVHTYTAEICLWYGDYARCEAECRRALDLARSQISRWAWVGLGGALMLQGRYAEALDVFEDSNRITEPLSALLAYRGETLRRSGQLDAARKDLEHALSLSPTRVSAWLNLGLIAMQQGCDAEVGDIFARLNAHLPELVSDVERDLGAPAVQAHRTCEAIAAIFEHSLKVMRGNRSSGRITYFLSDGVARVLAGRVLSA